MFILAGTADAIGKGFQIFGGLMKSSLVQTATGYAGTPIPGIGTNVRKTRCREAYKDGSTIKQSWVREKLPTFGNVFGLLAIVASFFIGNIKSDDPEKPNKMGFIASALKWTGLLGIVSSIYSHMQGTFVGTWLGEKEQALYISGGDLPKMLKDVDFEKEENKEYLRDKEHKYPISMSYNADERTEIERVIDEIYQGNTVRAFYIGGPGTGKTHTMYHTLNEFKKYAETQGKKVVLKEINADALATNISKKSLLEEGVDIVKAVDKNAGDQAEAVSSFFNLSKETRFEMMIDSFIDFAEQCPNDEMRVISIDEIDKLWKLAEGENGNINLPKMAFIATRFQKLLESKKVHILMTGNGTVDQMCGIDRLQAGQGIPPEIAGLKARLIGCQVHMTEPDFGAQTDLIAKEISRHSCLKTNDIGKTFDDIKNNITNIIYNPQNNFANFIYKEDNRLVFNEDIFSQPNIDIDEIIKSYTYHQLDGRSLIKAVRNFATNVAAGKKEAKMEVLIKEIEGHPQFKDLKGKIQESFKEKIKGAKSTKEVRKRQESIITSRLNSADSAIVKLIKKVNNDTAVGNISDLKKLRASLSETEPSGVLKDVHDLISESNLAGTDIHELNARAETLLKKLERLGQVDKTIAALTSSDEPIDEKLKAIKEVYAESVRSFEALKAKPKQLAPTVKNQAAFDSAMSKLSEIRTSLNTKNIAEKYLNAPDTLAELFETIETNLTRAEAYLTTSQQQPTIAA